MRNAIVILWDSVGGPFVQLIERHGRASIGCRALVRGAALAMLLSAGACQSRSPRTDIITEARASAANPSAATSELHNSPSGRSANPSGAYPPGRWRLADWSELAKSRVWVSHILIRHRDVPPNLVSFNAIGWTAAPAAPDRSREDALELATRVSGFAQRAPTQFAKFAEEFSEDVTTRHEGGSLGGVDASQWLRWPEALDAISALGYGDISKPVETAYGFHVFLRRPPPPQGSHSGAHIVIGYDTAPWLHSVLARRPIPLRSRDEAFALAQSIYERALNGPESFETLLQEYSEHCDAVRGGDFGEWSTDQQTPHPQAVEKLSQLEVGEIAPPIDSQYGFQIIRRTANRPRVTYAMQRVQIQRDVLLPPQGENSDAKVVQELQRIIDELQQQPARFEELQRQHCCVGTETWQEGQGSARSERVLAELEIGEIAPAPVLLEGGRHVILQRVAPGSWAPERVRVELPSPAKASLAQFASHARAAEIVAAGRAAARDLDLRGELAERLVIAHDVEQQFASSSSEEERWDVFLDVQRKVETLLGPAQFAQYTASVEKHAEHELLWGGRAGLGRLSAPRLAQ